MRHRLQPTVPSVPWVVGWWQPRPGPVPGWAAEPSGVGNAMEPCRAAEGSSGGNSVLSEGGIGSGDSQEYWGGRGVWQSLKLLSEQVCRSQENLASA